ncbi:heparin lyase I family protein [Rhizobium sp. R339]|uniref:heparin lyase I family protein n=1 Tax=Rhizobium sp. R339 TaxID=1764273 RepID=UPI0011317C82|nr:heparin lyase I family protein [Rhizobium sp. R339]
MTEIEEKVLFDGFDDHRFADEGGLVFPDKPEQRAGRFEFLRDEDRVGNGILRLSVQTPKSGPQSNLCKRAEVWERYGAMTSYQTGTWYGISVRFCSDYPKDSERYMIAQWKREIVSQDLTRLSPFLALRLRRGKLFVTAETHFRDEGARFLGAGGTPSKMWVRPQWGQMRALLATDDRWTDDDDIDFSELRPDILIESYGRSLPNPDSGWIDFIVFVRPDPRGRGCILLYANGNLIVKATGCIGYEGEGLGPKKYFKFGPYCDVQAADWALEFDNFRRGPTFESVS